MKKLHSIFLFTGALFLAVACSSDSEGTDGIGGAEDSVMTTDVLISEANELGEDAFKEKYPMDSEIELKGEVRAPATWNDKVSAKFGSGLNDLPITADFMFEANGGMKESTKEKVKIGEEVQFKGTVSSIFFKDGKLNRLGIKDCVAQ